MSTQVIEKPKKPIPKLRVRLKNEVPTPTKEQPSGPVASRLAPTPPLPPEKVRLDSVEQSLHGANDMRLAHRSPYSDNLRFVDADHDAMGSRIPTRRWDSTGAR